MTEDASALLAGLYGELGGADLELHDAPPTPGFDPFAMPGATARRRPVPIDADLPPEPPGAADLPSTNELPWASAATIAALVRDRRLGADQVRSALLHRVRALDGQLNAFVHVCDEGEFPRGTPDGPLAGVPVGLKDLIDVAGLPTTCGAAELGADVARSDARCWTLLRDAGAQLLGKLNTQEFAAGVTGDNDRFGPVTNPWSAHHVAGGSSSGSAAAVAAGLVPLALGTDTGGSVRIPAACCGVVGFKPTYGAVPVDGVAPLAWSLDHVGPLSRFVADAALATDVLAGTRCERAARAGAVAGLRSVRVGVPVEWLAGVSPPVAAAFDDTVARLRDLGADVVEVTGLPRLERIVAANRLIAFAEGSAAHAARLARGFGYGAAVRARMYAGREVSAGTYLTAQRVRREICAQLGRMWDDVDVLANPTLPCTAPPRGSTSVRIGAADLPVGLALLRLTATADLTGQPALAVPAGLADDGLPASVLITAPVGADELACFVGAAFESTLAPLRPPLPAT